MSETVGFIGLGAMGIGMAANLVKSGYRVRAYDPSARQQEAATAQGIELAGSPGEAAAAADRTVVSVVRTAAQTRDVLLGPDGVVAAGKPLTVVVASTLDPSTMEELTAELAGRDVDAVDATMSGGPWGAAEGTLTLMVSGPEETFRSLRPVLSSMGENIFHVGPRPGMAQAAKLAVQLSFGINMLAVFESLRIVRRHGIDEDQLMKMLSVSVGDSWVVRNWARVKPWWEHYVPGEDLDILLKDMRSTLREADEHLTSMPMTALAFQLMRHVWPAEPNETG